MIPSLATITLGLLASQAMASEHHEHKREAAVDYVTVVETAYVTAGAGDATISTSVSTSIIAETVPTSPKVTSPEVEYETSSVAVTTTTAAAVTTSSESTAASTSAASTSSSSSSSESVGSGGALGITYSPYTSSGGCKTAAEVASDIAKLSGFSIIRLYAVDCDQVANVYAAKASGQKLFLGVYDMSSIEASIEAMNSAIGGDWSDVVTVSIGNELVNSGEATVSEIGSYVSTGRSALKAVGYTGPVVSVDTFIAVIENPGLCSYSDYMAVNAHAYFDGTVTSGQAGTWAVEQIQRVWEACSGDKSVTIVESGWPWKGDTNGVAVASTSDQDAAISALKSSIANDVYLFNAFNDLWKSPGEYNCEQYWGIYGDASA